LTVVADGVTVTVCDRIGSCNCSIVSPERLPLNKPFSSINSSTILSKTIDPAATVVNFCAPLIKLLDTADLLADVVDATDLDLLADVVAGAFAVEVAGAFAVEVAGAFAVEVAGAFAVEVAGAFAVEVAGAFADEEDLEEAFAAKDSIIS
jgi:hypothetical protein